MYLMFGAQIQLIYIHAVAYNWNIEIDSNTRLEVNLGRSLFQRYTAKLHFT